MSIFLCLVLALFMNLTLADQVQAQHPLLLEEKSPTTGWDEWGLSITPYAWLAGQSSDVGGEKLRQSFNDLASITDFGFQATAAAKMGEEGGAFAGAMSVSPGVWMYQLTDEGLAVELTGKGTKYFKDYDLN